MNTVEETRRARLKKLVEAHKSVAGLCQALGYARNDSSRLSRILNSNERKERGQIYQMGSPMARSIEEKLNLPEGWMDTPLSYAELAGQDDPKAKVLAVFEALPAYQVDTALRLLDALTQSAKSNGTSGQ